MKCLCNVYWKCLNWFMLNIIFRLFFGKGGEDMMAMLWAQQIMLGKKTYNQVPRLLKDKVKEILIDSGCEDLITE